eukprot:TRINITY_DN15547_c0_g1_i1.p1 TRINITY_DN15547_c0_g1~~TRINITY_DN15547_c0_g1_i1.p1  ORF type:complete len:592 (+),score=111.97 TRINITY_DN15547_c0_g1_i1:165-1940(+)
MDPVVSKNAPPKPSKEVKPGNFKITLVEARNLGGKKGKDEWLSPFCQIGPFDDEGNVIASKAIKTDVIRKTQRPTWNVTYNFAITAQFKGLVLECWDDVPGKKPRFLGRVEFPPQILLDGRELTTWFSFAKREGKQYAKEVIKGEVYLSLLYMSNDLRKELDPEGWAAEQAAAAAAAAANASEGSGSRLGSSQSVKSKRPEQLDELLTDVRASKVEAILSLIAFIVQASYLNASEENLDHEYAKVAVEKGAIDAVIQGLRGNDMSDFKWHSFSFLGKLSELDTETLDLMELKGVGKEVLKIVLSGLPVNDDTMFTKAISVFSLAKHAGIKKGWVEGGILKQMVEILKKDGKREVVFAGSCKAVNSVLAESEHTTPSKKDISQNLIENGIIEEVMNNITPFTDSEVAIEQALPLLDTLVEFTPKCGAIGNAGIDLFVSLMQKHRFPIQVHCASVLAKMAEEDEYAKHLVEGGGVSVIVKLLGTESFLRSYEQKSREVCIKCLNRLATISNGTAQIRDAGIAKVLQPSIQPYGDKFIIQIQSILLIKSLAKDEVCRQQLVQAGVSQLLASAAAKHTVTRLQKLVQELKDLYHW